MPSRAPPTSSPATVPPSTNPDYRISNPAPMVTRTEVAEHSRGPPSVASRTSRSRHQARGRSHAGGSTYAARNEFPFFAQSGDVEIVLQCDGQEKRYLLHRFNLAQFSGFFDAGMSDEWSRNPQQPPLAGGQEHALSAIGEESSHVSSSGGPVTLPNHRQNTALSPPRRRWRYELDWENLEDENDEPILVQRPPQGALFTPSRAPPSPVDTRARPSHQSNSFFRSVGSLALPSHRGPASQSTAQLAQTPDPALSNPLLRDYDNLFRIFYNHAPNLSTTNIAAAYSECKSLLSLADLYHALPVVGPRIDHHLLRFSSRLFKQIAKYPPSYLKLGYLSRSRIIFSEALTHVVGQWPLALPYIKPPGHSGSGYEVPQSVIDLIEDKVDELDELKQKIEMKLFRLTLTTSRGERVNPVNDYLGWLAMSLWRQWLAENTTPEVRGILKNSPAPGSRPGTGGSNRPLNVTTHNNAVVAQPAPPPPATMPNTTRIFRLISSPNPDLFLPHEELKRFLKIQHPNSTTTLYTRENMRRFERKIDEIKNVARDLVKPLTRNCLELDIRMLGEGTGGLGYLTCTKLEEDEIPWEI